MKTICKMDRCTGCRACEQVCPKKCISFAEDVEGFIYPSVNQEICVECGLCQNICHALEKDKTNLLCEEKNRQGWYGWSLNKELHKESSSGGAFSEIVDVFLQGEGTVFGAAFSEDYLSVQQTACSADNFQPLRKSKYVFSDPQNSYSSVKEQLTKGNRVVYCGTPCQVAGLRSYLQNVNQAKLLTIDFICHGVPSPMVYRNHIKWLTKGTVKKVDFRSKRMGAKHCLLVEDCRGEKIYSKSEDMYFEAFLTDSILRKCCYQCQYSEGNHVSDFTLADFWEVTRYEKKVDCAKGVSLVVMNTQKAGDLLAQLQMKMQLTRLNEEAFRYVYVSHRDYNFARRKRFFEEYRRYGRNFHEWKKQYQNTKKKFFK